MDAVRLAQTKMKLWYDDKHSKPIFNTGWAYL
jgi:hemolysin-activating ACP:hemolysin acyltransferase